jgi:alpha-amylase
MPGVCFYFQVHQPLRVKKYRVFDIGHEHNYFDDNSQTSLNNRWIMEKVAGKSYLPANRTLLRLLKRHPEFKISFSFSGIFLDQIENDFPEVLKSFQDLVDTGRVEVLSETHYHSLSFLYSRNEFRHQVKQHRRKIKKLFGVVPKVFRNTELIYNNDIAHEVESMGYKAILAEGADHILEWRSPNFLYKAKGTKKIKLF